MNTNSQLLCAHSALLFAGLLGLGVFGLAGWLPPVLPSMDAATLQQMFIEQQTRIRLGASVLVAGAVFWWTFSAVVSVQLQRIEGRHPVLAYAQFLASSGTVIVLVTVGYLWLALAYRPANLEPSTMQLINDFCWMMFIGAWPPAVLQATVIGVCILKDRSATPVYPRWVGFANLWIAFLFMPGALIPFVKSGPFAWDGVLAFWLVAVAFFGWILMLWSTTVRAIKAQSESPA